uniref:uncharacterized protein LOC122592040 n=1 Tax=Erigeron canadensis TaxID=72917 RepID=UPI001CB8DC86|nr:uncharacterized protein LOC122592040 [Erigeron canadensis]
MEKRVGSTLIIDEPFEWYDDSSLEVFANAIEAEEAESSTAWSGLKRKVVNRNRWTASQSSEYLCKPTTHDIHRLFEAHEERHHLPGMLGSLDCTHLVWKMRPNEWRGQYKRGDHEYPTIMLEATTSQDLWICYAFFGPLGALNDINMLQQSPLFLPERMGTASYYPFTLNGRIYRRGYYLVYGIYLIWSTFVKAYKYPTNPKEKITNIDIEQEI